MSSALLIMDVQVGVVERFPDGAVEMLDAAARAAQAARRAGVPVIYIRVGYRPGAPEISPRNRSFSGYAAAGGIGIDDPKTQVHPAVAPQDGDLVVVKKRASAFSGSDLEMLLRSLGIESLVLSGISTSGVVLSTLRQAADLDYELTVLRDGCLDADPEIHRVLIDKLFPRHATVLTADEWIAGLGNLSGGSFD